MDDPDRDRQSLLSLQEPDLFRAAVEATLDAVVITSPNLDLPGPAIEYVNPAFCTMTGYAPEEVLGRTPRLLQGPATDRAVLDRMRRDLDTRQRFAGQSINYRKDGEAYIVDWLIAPIPGPAGGVAHWVAVLRDVTRREQLEANERVLLSELQHRVRNVLSVVRTLAHRTGKTTLSVEDYVSNLQGRIGALARTQVLLTADADAGADLKTLLSSEFAAQGVIPSQVRLDGPELRLSAKAVEVIAMAVHELTTNAIRFGALSDPHGAVRVCWRVDEARQPRRLHLDWSETGGPGAVASPLQKGFGSELIERQAAHELGGQAKLEFRTEGVRCTIELPLIEASSILDTGVTALTRSGAYKPV